MPVTSVFQSIIDKAKNIGLFNVKSYAARKWMQAQAAKLSGVTPDQMMKANPQNLMNSTHSIRQTTFGRMIMYYYDPKWKHKLPYYDRFPVIFVVEFAKGGFYGLNMHYLPPYLRAKLFDAMYQQLIYGDDEKRRLRISYQILKSSSNLMAFKPCFKHYLYNHVRSRYMVIDPSEWDTVLFLPLARFERGGGKLDGVPGKIGGNISQQRIWADSRRKIR